MSVKETILATTTTTLFAFGFAASTVLHFTPWPHGSGANDTLSIPYTSATLSTIESEAVDYQWDRKKLPRYVCIKNDPTKYPVTVDKERVVLDRDYLDGKQTISNYSKVHFVDSNGRTYNIMLKLNAYPKRQTGFFGY